MLTLSTLYVKSLIATAAVFWMECCSVFLYLLYDSLIVNMHIQQRCFLYRGTKCSLPWLELTGPLMVANGEIRM